MPPHLQPWLAVAAIVSSMAMVFSFVRAWRRRIDRNERVAERERNTPIADPFKAALQVPGQAVARDGALDVAPLNDGVEVAWSLACKGLADNGPAAAWLYLEQGEAARVVAAVRSSAELGGGELEELAVRFGVEPELSERDGMLYLTLPADAATAPFDRLSLLAAAVHLAAPPPDSPAIAPVFVSWFADGWEHGALPPFGRLERVDGAVVVTATSRLSHRPRVRERLEFGRWSLPLSDAIAATATAALPADVLGEGPFLRVIGGDPARLLAAIGAG